MTTVTSVRTSMLLGLALGVVIATVGLLADWSEWLVYLVAAGVGTAAVALLGVAFARQYRHAPPYTTSSRHTSAPGRP
jgi:hypothetical protein